MASRRQDASFSHRHRLGVRGRTAGGIRSERDERRRTPRDDYDGGCCWSIRLHTMTTSMTTQAHSQLSITGVALHPRLLLLLLLLLLFLLPLTAVLAAPASASVDPATADDDDLGDCVCGLEGLTPRIHHGDKSVAGQFPWMVYIAHTLGRIPIQSCAGTVINDRFILTAAHCLEPPEPLIKDPEVFTSLGIWIGDQTDPHNLALCQAAGIKRVITHPDYVKDAVNMTDVALVELLRPLTFSASLTPICLPDFTDFDNFLAAGWGYTDHEMNDPECLMQADLAVVSEAACREVYSGISDHEMCAGDEERNVCPGDSGGPLMSRREGVVYQAGVTAAGTTVGLSDCGLTKNPAIFERVSSHLEWILRTSLDSGARWCRSPFDPPPPVQPFESGDAAAAAADLPQQQRQQQALAAR